MKEEDQKRKDTGMTNNKYILNEQGVPVVEPDLFKWGKWFQDSFDQRRVKQEMVGDLKVSTVFLGLDHSRGKGPPALWETMVFAKGSSMHLDFDRCSGSREQAEAMH
jgi:hypothetical protein